jgi:hypothetical protein
MVGAGMVEIPAGRFRMGSVGFYPEEGPVREVEVVSRSTAGRLRSQGLPGLLRRPGIGRSPSGLRWPLTTRTPTHCCWSLDRRCFVPLPTRFRYSENFGLTVCWEVRLAVGEMGLRGAAKGTPAPCSLRSSTWRPVPPRPYSIQLPAESSGLASSSTALGSLVSKSSTFAHSGAMVMRAIRS